MEATKIIIIGAGGHAAELRDYINHNNAVRPNATIQVVGFIDDNEMNYHHYQFPEPFLGTIGDHKIRKDVSYLMGIANLEFRKPIIESFKKQGGKFIGFIHPTVILSPSAVIGEGVVISHNASVGPKVTIGNFNMLNSRCTIGHDSVIGNYNFISPQVAISGNTHIGDENLLGTNSCTLPGITIGNNNKIAAGMVVFKPVGNGETVIHRFKERLVIRTHE
ncbi:MAG: acetyltransferase [Cyclobacteriaceae bacterium]|nr:acetyltransferase [Cyclobacteriaceae bacterium]